jgi:hypothetical protein
MADKWPLANGAWSDSANWNSGTLPQPADVVYADGKTVSIDQNVTVASLRGTQRSGGTIGGFFLTTDGGFTINADVYGGGGNHTLQMAVGHNCVLNGNAYGNTTGSNIYTVLVSGTNTMNGNLVSGGSQSNARGLLVATGAVLNGNIQGHAGSSGDMLGLTGTMYGNILRSTGAVAATIGASGVLVGDVLAPVAGGVYRYTVDLQSGGTIIGNVYGSSAEGGVGARVANGARVYGNAYAGAGAYAWGLDVQQGPNGAVFIGDSYGGSGLESVGAWLGIGGKHFGNAYGGTGTLAAGTGLGQGCMFFGNAVGSAQAPGVMLMSLGAFALGTAQGVNSTGYGIGIRTSASPSGNKVCVTRIGDYAVEPHEGTIELDRSFFPFWNVDQPDLIRRLFSGGYTN